MSKRIQQVIWAVLVVVCVVVPVMITASDALEYVQETADQLEQRNERVQKLLGTFRTTVEE